jgi:hypothetical protein
VHFHPGVLEAELEYSEFTGSIHNYAHKYREDSNAISQAKHDQEFGLPVSLTYFAHDVYLVGRRSFFKLIGVLLLFSRQTCSSLMLIFDFRDEYRS